MVEPSVSALKNEIRAAELPGFIFPQKRYELKNPFGLFLNQCGSSRILMPYLYLHCLFKWIGGAMCGGRVFTAAALPGF